MKEIENPFKNVETPFELLGQLGGAVSTCWTQLEMAGTFQAERAAELVEFAMDRLIELYSPTYHSH